MFLQPKNPLRSKCYRSLDETMRMLLISASNEAERPNQMGLLQKQSQKLVWSYNPLSCFYVRVISGFISSQPQSEWIFLYAAFHTLWQYRV